MKAVVVRMPDELHGTLMAEAGRETAQQRQQISMNTVIVRALADYTAGMGREKEDNMTIYKEMENIPALEAVGTALVQYAESLDGSRFQRYRSRWVMTPRKFVAISVQWKRNQQLMVTLRGYPGEFERELGLGRELPLQRERASYSKCWVTHPKQLKAAASYIALAYQLYRRGRRR